MCGIFGFDRVTPTTRRMAPWLAWEMEKRGSDSWGMTDGTHIHKELGPITASYESIPTDWEIAIFHTRHASVGAVTIPNQHPFVFVRPDETEVLGVHNGHISNHVELAVKYERDFEVDSMHIFAHLAEGLGLEELRGYGGCVWFDAGELYLARFNMQDLNVLRLDSGELVICSLREPAVRAARSAGTSVKYELKINGDTRYRFERREDGSGHDLVEAGALPFGSRYVYTSTYTGEGWADREWDPVHHRMVPKNPTSGENGNARPGSAIPINGEASTTASTEGGLEEFAGCDEPNWNQVVDDTPSTPNIHTAGAGLRRNNICMRCRQGRCARRSAVLCKACLNEITRHTTYQSYASNFVVH